jgi:protein-disulfide isomerase
MTKSYSEDNFWAVLWEFLPGIIKFLSIVGVVAIVFNIFTVALGSSTDVRANSKTFDVDIQRDYNFTYGNAESKVKLLYFEDLQCPACKTNNPIMEEIEAEYKDRVNFVFKHYPLSSSSSSSSSKTR